MAKREELLTRYFIYATERDDGEVLDLEGEVLAKSSEGALREWFAKPPARDAEGLYVAISENARRIRRVSSKVKTSIADVGDLPPEIEEPAKLEASAG